MILKHTYLLLYLFYLHLFLLGEIRRLDPPASNASLPEGWKEMQDDFTKLPIYVNDSTEESTWYRADIDCLQRVDDGCNDVQMQEATQKRPANGDARNCGTKRNTNQRTPFWEWVLISGMDDIDVRVALRGLSQDGFEIYNTLDDSDRGPLKNAILQLILAPSFPEERAIIIDQWNAEAYTAKMEEERLDRILRQQAEQQQKELLQQEVLERRRKQEMELEHRRRSLDVVQFMLSNGKVHETEAEALSELTHSIALQIGSEDNLMDTVMREWHRNKRLREKHEPNPSLSGYKSSSPDPDDTQKKKKKIIVDGKPQALTVDAATATTAETKVASLSTSTVALATVEDKEQKPIRALSSLKAASLAASKAAKSASLALPKEDFETPTKDLCLPGLSTWTTTAGGAKEATMSDGWDELEFNDDDDIGLTVFPSFSSDNNADK